MRNTGARSHSWLYTGSEVQALVLRLGQAFISPTEPLSQPLVTVNALRKIR